MKFYFKKLLPAILLSFFLLNSCGIYKKTDARKIPTNANDRVKKNMEEGRGFKLGKLNSNKKGGDFQFATSNPLWRAALEKLDFAPLNNVDYGGGIIVTDWFSEGGASEQLKITVRFLSNEIRSDALSILIYKKICDNQNSCSVNKIQNNLNNQIKFSILKKAAQIQNSDLVKKKEDDGPVRLPKGFK